MDREWVATNDLERDHGTGVEGPGGQPCRLRRTGRALPADRLRRGAGPTAQPGRGTGAGAGSVPARYEEAAPAPRRAVLRRLVAADHRAHGDQSPDSARPAAQG